MQFVPLISPPPQKSGKYKCLDPKLQVWFWFMMRKSIIFTLFPDFSPNSACRVVTWPLLASFQGDPFEAEDEKGHLVTRLHVGIYSGNPLSPLATSVIGYQTIYFPVATIHSSHQVESSFRCHADMQFTGFLMSFHWMLAVVDFVRLTQMF